MPTGTLDVIQGDITQVSADAIVNAANTRLAAGGGVCGAIFRAAGVAELTAACRPLAPCPAGSAVMTPAFAIRTAKYVIHAVGPVYADHTPQDARRLLRGAYQASMDLARQNDCRTIAFPAISTGIYGYPLEAACHEAAAVCRAEIENAPLAIKLVAFDTATMAALKKAVTG